MGKNKKKGPKKQPNAPPAELESPAAEVHEKQHEEEQTASTEVESLPETPQNDVHEQNGKVPDVISENTAANDKIERLQQEISDLKLKLANEEERGKAQEQIAPSEIADVTQTEAYKHLKAERDEFEGQYNNLLNRISSMKNVFNKMKESQEELETVKEQLSEYESQNLRFKNKADLLSKEKTELEKTIRTLNDEFSNLDEERESLQNECKNYKEELKKVSSEFEEASDGFDREIQTQRKANDHLKAQLEDLVVTLENSKQDLHILSEEKKHFVSMVESNASERESLERSIKELETELENVTSQVEEDKRQKKLEINALRAQLDKSQESNSELTKSIEQLKKELQSMSEDVAAKKRLEQECKERVLQIGKLRHEAIILNEHLTKALTMLKQSSDSESVDKELISNLLISFVAIPRADPRKFEVLDLIASFLNWDDDKKRQAGLLHNNERLSKSAGSGSSTENFVSLWTDFLEKESEK